MTAFKINASLQLVPISEPAAAMALIDEAIALISASGVTFSVGPFGTSVEGLPDEILQLVKNIDQLCRTSNLKEWLINVQWHGAVNHDVSAQSKTSKFNS